MLTETLNLKHLKQQLQAHLQQHFADCENCDLQLLAHGEANVIYRLNETKLVRVAVNTPNQRFDGDIYRVSAFERSVLTYLHGSEIGHTLYSTMLTPDPTFAYSYLITNYLDGTALDYSRDHLEKSAHTLARLHRLPLTAGYTLDRLPQIPIVQQPLTLFYQEAKTYAQPYLEAADADPAIVEMLQAVLAKAEARLSSEPLLEQYPHRCLVHSDHTYENWVINDRQAYLIDWEWAEIGSPAGDLGHFLSPVTIQRRQGYQLPAADRRFFLQCYFDALDNLALAQTIRTHFAIFGAFPAVRSLCWTAGYWVTAVRWYADALDDSPSAAEHLARQQTSRRQFAELWRSVMQELEGDCLIGL